MSSKLNDYYQKKQMMQQLAEELEQLEANESLKKDLEFEKKLRDLLDEYNKAPRDAANVLVALDPALSTTSKAKPATGQKRALKTYKNPHTGEIVKTRGANHKTLNEWRDKYGKEAVQSWVQD